MTTPTPIPAAAVEAGNKPTESFQAVIDAREEAKKQLGPLRETVAMRRSKLGRRERHPDDLAVDRFAAAMKDKLTKKRAEGRGGWDDKEDCSNAWLSRLLHEHVSKGDPVDIGNFAMMIHQRGERVSALPHLASPAVDVADAEPVCYRSRFAIPTAEWAMSTRKPQFSGNIDFECEPLYSAATITTLAADLAEARRHIAAFRDNLQVSRECGVALEADRDALAERLRVVEKIADELRQMIDAQMERTKP